MGLSASTPDPNELAAIGTLVGGWAAYQERLLAAIAPLSNDQMELRPTTDHWAVWQLASNMAGGRAYWFHDVLGEGDPSVRAMFHVASTTVPGLPIEDAGWEDDENRPRAAAEIVEAFRETWQVIEDCLGRWTAADLLVEVQRRPGQSVTRAWVVWHLVEHELQHGTEIALILRNNGLPTLEL
jgi:uncharacterized damage-inducible protein DinB